MNHSEQQATIEIWHCLTQIDNINTTDNLDDIWHVKVVA